MCGRSHGVVGVCPNPVLSLDTQVQPWGCGRAESDLLCGPFEPRPAWAGPSPPCPRGAPVCSDGRGGAGKGPRLGCAVRGWGKSGVLQGLQSRGKRPGPERGCSAGRHHPAEAGAQPDSCRCRRAQGSASGSPSERAESLSPRSVSGRGLGQPQVSEERAPGGWGHVGGCHVVPDQVG